jgi:hypothetical protein
MAPAISFILALPESCLSVYDANIAANARLTSPATGANINKFIFFFSHLCIVNSFTITLLMLFSSLHLIAINIFVFLTFVYRDEEERTGNTVRTSRGPKNTGHSGRAVYNACYGGFGVTAFRVYAR